MPPCRSLIAKERAATRRRSLISGFEKHHPRGRRLGPFGRLLLKALDDLVCGLACSELSCRCTTSYRPAVEDSRANENLGAMML